MSAKENRDRGSILSHRLRVREAAHSKHGRWYSLSSLLAVCAAAVLAGATTIEALVEWVAEAAPGS
jgi:hypothetical protein